MSFVGDSEASGLEDVGLFLKAQRIRLRFRDSLNIRFGLKLYEVTVCWFASVMLTPSPLIKLFTPFLILSYLFLIKWLFSKLLIEVLVGLIIIDTLILLFITYLLSHSKGCLWIWQRNRKAYHHREKQGKWLFSRPPKFYFPWFH